MSRLSSISETAGGQTWTAASATYNAASQITSLVYGPSTGQYTENRAYNNLLQMTRDTVTNSTGTTLMDMQYIFPAPVNGVGVNNGKVSQTIDGVLGETVNYTYDALNRLIAATATNNNWGEAYSFDGFGNLQSKTPTVGTAPTGGGANPANNQPTGVTVDSNGNNLGTPSAVNAYDTENHLISSPLSGTQTYYDYDPWGKRVWKEVPPNASAPTPLCEFYFYGLGGQKLETFNCTYQVYTVYYPNYYQQVVPGPYTSAGVNINFGVGGKLLQSKGVWVVTDRQGSVRANSNGEQMSYFPYGEERTSTANDREKYGTYMRDGIGQDYADQRYYNSNNGAFWNPDPGGIRTANPRNPISWNRYAYTNGDPINFFDPVGKDSCAANDDACADGDCGNGESPCAADGTEGGGGDGTTVLNSTGGTLSLGAATASSTAANPANNTGSLSLPTTTTCANGGDPNNGCATLVNFSTTVTQCANGGDPNNGCATLTTNATTSQPTSSAPSTNGGNYTQITTTIGFYGIIGVGGSLTTTSSGSTYAGPVLSIGPSLPVSISVVNGSISAGNIDDWTAGLSYGWGVGAVMGFGGQQSSTTTNGNQYSTETGFYTPQLGVNAGYNYCLAGACKR